jgi:hypothetical protein
MFSDSIRKQIKENIESTLPKPKIQPEWKKDLLVKIEVAKQPQNYHDAHLFKKEDMKSLPKDNEGVYK